MTIFEKIVAKRLTEHMKTHNMNEKFQSAYKTCHSTETALARVHNDILLDIDNKRGVILVLLDLSAAFDTIDHSLLLLLLEQRLGLSEYALSWILSYLSARSQSIIIDGKHSKSVPLSYGVPQGSVLGPFLYTIYTLPLGDILRNFGIAYHLYADDTQLYLSFDVRDDDSLNNARETMQRCVSLVKAWMTANKLKLNDEKTEVMFLSSPYFKSAISTPNFEIDETIIKPNSSARNIGIVFDSTLSMNQQVNNMCKVAHFHLRNLGAVRKFISQEACAKLVHAFITSRLDYGNSLLSGIPDYQIYRLQRILHIAARIVTLSPVSHDIINVLRNLHWLPIRQRIRYKILLLTFRALQGTAPEYISELLINYKPEKNLRSGVKDLLVVPKTNLVSAGDRALSVVAPKEWNKLPYHIKNTKTLSAFKKSIKTHLFSEVYED